MRRGIDTAGGAFSTDRDISLNTGGGTVNVTSSTNDALLTGVISGNGFTKTGGGTLIVFGLSNYTGATTISGGTISLGTNTALGTGSLTTLGSSVNVDYQDGVTIANPIDLQADAGLRVTNASATQSGVNIFSCSVGVSPPGTADLCGTTINFTDEQCSGQARF